MNVKKRTAVLFLGLTLVLGLGVGALATANSETISALLNRDLKVIYNGQEQQMTDAAGTRVYPISYSNTTYLPVRAISSMVGLPIEFDGESYAVVMGTAEKQPSALTALEHTDGTDYSTIIRDAEELKITTADGIQTYTTGFNWSIWNGSASASKDRCMMFTVKGYEEVSFSAWSDIDASVKVYDQDGAVYATFKVAAGTVVTKTLTLEDNTAQLGFAADGPAGSKGTLKILDATAK